MQQTCRYVYMKGSTRCTLDGTLSSTRFNTETEFNYCLTLERCDGWWQPPHYPTLHTHTHTHTLITTSDRLSLYLFFVILGHPFTLSTAGTVLLPCCAVETDPGGLERFGARWLHELWNQTHLFSRNLKGSHQYLGGKLYRTKLEN